MVDFLAKASKLLVEEFGFRPAGGKTKPNGAGHDDGQHERVDWAAQMANIIAGRDLHDNIRDLGASFRCAMGAEAAVRTLQALMLASTAPHDERWKARFDDIPRSVHGAEEKHGAEAAEPEPESTQPKWPTLDSAAMYGLAGDLVRTIEPHSEADPGAVLVQFLAAFGSAVGNGPFFQVEADRHRGNLFAVLVGESSKARKGTSWGRVLQFMMPADKGWTATRVLSGLSSGEGLIQEVRDPRKEYDRKERQEVVVDAGVADKRLLVNEPELSRTITAASRSGNICPECCARHGIQVNSPR